MNWQPTRSWICLRLIEGLKEKSNSSRLLVWRNRADCVAGPIMTPDPFFGVEGSLSGPIMPILAWGSAPQARQRHEKWTNVDLDRLGRRRWNRRRSAGDERLRPRRLRLVRADWAQHGDYQARAGSGRAARGCAGRGDGTGDNDRQLCSVSAREYCDR